MKITINDEAVCPVNVIERLAETMSYDQLDAAIAHLKNMQFNLYIQKDVVASSLLYPVELYSGHFSVAVSDKLLSRSPYWEEEDLERIIKLVKARVLRFHDLEYMPKELLLIYAHKADEIAAFTHQ